MCNESAAQAAYRRSRKRRKRAIAAAQWGILIVLLAAWEILARTGVLDAFLLSCPSRMLESIAALARSGELALHLATTLWETIIGFVLGAVLGVGVAVLLWWSDTLNRILDPYLVILGALPKIALGPVLIVWIGAGMPAIIVMTLLISVIVTTVTALGGFLSVEREKQMADLYDGGISRRAAHHGLCVEAEREHELDRCDRGGIPRLARGAGVPDRLRRAGVPNGSGDGLDRGAVRLRGADVPAGGGDGKAAEPGAGARGLSIFPSCA